VLAAGIILGWAAYGLGSWGYCLVRGWDVPFRAWFSPLNPYQFPPDGPKKIPDTKLFPGSPSGVTETPVTSQLGKTGIVQTLQQSADQLQQTPGPPVSRGGRP
jgi:hypothetical protein